MQAPGFEIRYDHWRLANGLRVLAAHRPWAKTFDSSLSYRVGWADESKRQCGLSHLLEHLAFAGPNRAVVETLTEQGLDVNAHTAWEETEFQASGHASLFPRALSLYANILKGHRLEEQMVASELRLIAHEVASRVEDWSELKERKLMAELIGDPRFARPYPKNVRGLGRLSIDELGDFARTHFAPRNAVLTIVSPLDSAALRQQVERELDRGEFARQEAVQARVAAGSSQPPINRLIFRSNPGSQTRIILAHVVRPRHKHPLAAIAMLADILGGGPHSLLFRSLRRDSQLSYHVGSDVITLSGVVLLDSHTTVHRRAVVQALGIMLTHISRLQTSGVDDEVFEQSRLRLARYLDLLEDNSVDLCQWMTQEALHGDCDIVPSPETYREQLRGLRCPEFNAIAAEVLDPINRTTAIVGTLNTLRRARLRTAVERQGAQR